MTLNTRKYRNGQYGEINKTMIFSCLALKFQEELLRTMMQVESVFFTLAESLNQDCLVICDRGAMDASACKPSNLQTPFFNKSNSRIRFS